MFNMITIRGVRKSGSGTLFVSRGFSIMRCFTPSFFVIAKNHFISFTFNLLISIF